MRTIKQYAEAAKEFYENISILPDDVRITLTSNFVNSLIQNDIIAQTIKEKQNPWDA